MITERQKQLLKTIITTYIRDAQPVASGFLANILKATVSSATIRNEMVALEKEGLIEQPHTSAGRVPTEKAYQFYVKEILDLDKAKVSININKISSVEDIKTLAKQMAEFTGEAVVVAFAKNDFYYTGISNLFSKPEFADRNMIINMSQVIDHLDKVLENLFVDSEEIEVMIGQANPFGNKCSAVLGSFKFQKEKRLIAVLGTLRLDYEKAYALIKEVRENIK
ncbi:MAG: Transcriptional regulator of heat shock protein [Parcubacteria group bacterium GW2011_GWC2_38_7]|nr:MAG: Transcriptional regulator of heat shock protein [Parcubacteria group bacterium GW2011_GWC2_38_7]